MARRLTHLVFLTVIIHFAHAQSMTYDEVLDLELSENRKNSEWGMQQDYVIMISIDGFRHDYARKFNAENILRLANQGAQVERLIASFPTKTFPNHYTLVTGLLPGNHGIVSNEFYSRGKDYWYKIRDKKAVTDPSWYGGKPLWVLAEEQGMLSANFFWVGSEAPIGGLISNYSYAYNARIPNECRIRRILDWLTLPEVERPHLMLGYISLVDDAGHRYGPDHENTRSAVLEVDALIGDLMDGVEHLNLPVNIVLVSDHGMSEINQGIVLPEVVDLQDAKVSYSFPPMIYQPDDAKKKKLYEELLKVNDLEVYTHETIPGYLRFQNKDRIGDLMILTDAPTIILAEPGSVTGGTHGFNPYTHEEMGAIFYTYGPSIKPGVTLPPTENIHVYPFIASLLNLNVDVPIDGNNAALEPMRADFK
ncbi:MAG: ectonucleotide pyrophosphatase/phosphodiesterase [Marinoscillum sp.]